LQKHTTLLATISNTVHRLKETRVYKALSIPMMTQFRGIFWNDLKVLVLGMIFMWYFPVLYPVLLLFILCNIATTIFAFVLDCLFDFSLREVKVHREAKTWKDIAREHGGLRNIATMAKKPLTSQRNVPQPKRNNRQEQPQNRDQRENIDSRERFAEFERMQRMQGPTQNRDFAPNTGETHRIEPPIARTP
jgi:hypothetical protein